MMVIYSFLVLVIFKRGSAMYSALLFSALISWRWFTFSTLSSVKSITSNASIIKSIRVPLSIFPTVKVFVGFYNYLYSLIAIFPLLFLFHVKLTTNVLWLPVVVFVQLLFTLGVALILSMMGVYVKDTENFVKAGLRAWFYLSPGLYSVHDRVPDEYVKYFMLNPFSGLFESYKNILVRGTPPDPYLAYVFVLSVVLVLMGVFCHSRCGNNVTKVL